MPSGTRQKREGACGGIMLGTQVGIRKAGQVGGLACGLLASVAVGALAMAQDAPERITVTAIRTGVDWLDRADGVARLDEAEILRVNADHIQEILIRAPGVGVERGSGGEHLTAIRSPVLSAGAGAGSFLYLEDGVSLRSAGFANVNGLFESVSELAQGIEIVRGPGSVLYGSNAVHGMINVVTPTPLENGARIDLSASTLDRNKLTLDATRVGDFGGLYAGISVIDEGGWREAASMGEQKALLRWDAELGRFDAATTFAVTNLNQETAGFAVGPDAYKNTALSRRNPNPEAYRDAQTARLQSRISWEQSDRLSFAVTPYARWNDMTFLQHFLPDQSTEEGGHWSVGALNTAYWQASERLGVVAGVDLEYTDGFLTETQTRASFGAPINGIPTFPQGVHYDYEIVATTAAAYVDLDFAITDLWSLQLGARAEKVRYDYDNLTNADTIGRFQRPADRVDEFDAVTPKAALLRRFGDTSVAYLRYARGSRAPQTSDLYRLQNFQVVGQIEQETLDSVELGWRGRTDRITWDLAAFAMEKEHFFFRDAAGLNVPDGETKHVGVEGEFTVPLGSFFEAGLAATYAEHTYEFDRPSNGIVAGTEMDTAPNWIANGQIRWTPIEPLEVEAEWVHMGEYFTDEANNASYPGHDLLHLRGTYEARDGLALYVIVRNALNTEYAERADFAFGNDRYWPGEDRSFTFGVRKTF
jgi:outer membrane receptor protein involved in Fe transport